MKNQSVIEVEKVSQNSKLKVNQSKVSEYDSSADQLKRQNNLSRKEDKKNINLE